MDYSFHEERYCSSMKRYPWVHSIILLLILGGGIATFALATGDRTLQLMTGVITAAAYVLWGIVHHALVGDLHRKIVVEYLLIGYIAIILLMTLALS